MDVPPAVKRYLDRAGRRVIGEAGKLWTRHHPPFERLAELTSIAASPSEPTYLFSTRDQAISPSVFAHSGYEEDQLRWVLDYLGQPQKERTVVEVGANIGTTAIPLLVRYGAARVEAFEPEPFNYDLLRCNLILNHVDARALTHQTAISDANGEVLFELCDINFGDHRVRSANGAGAGVHGEANRPTITVAARRLDDAVTTPAAEIGLIWVDAQGHEAHILAGAPLLLASGIPWAIEYWPYGLSRQDGLDRLNRALADRFTYVVDVRQSMRDGRAVRVETSALDRLAGGLGDDYTDLILVPEESP
jgi:FkbM family methyltransferase